MRLAKGQMRKFLVKGLQGKYIVVKYNLRMSLYFQ
ncbi:unnamed protein product [Paramecium sonneborni]|uniref:Uncharacterized protein n=1 Tax=Paramecium sonneborni TaxID=65129 RepID=A0A8S1L1Y6_9CILI|nr:unnamed protein product [Paramecium sonneborni]